MTTINKYQIREELCQFLRYSDILSTTVRGVTRTSSNYTVGAGGEATHTFTGNTPVRDFKVLTVDGTSKYYLRDYTMNWNTGVLTWNTALTVGQEVVYQIDWGTGDKIFPDYPRDDLTLTSFPRVGIGIPSFTTEPLGLGGATHISDMLVSIIVYVPVNSDSAVAGGFGGLANLEEAHRLIRDAIRTNAKLFYTFNWITPAGQGPLLKGTNNKLLGLSADYRIRFRVE